LPTYQELNTRHPCCGDKQQRRIRRIRALYEGGERFEECLTEFLPQRQAEDDGLYSLRRREAHYKNYLGPIIDYFTALLFTGRPVAAAKDEAGEEVPEPAEFFGEFREDCDRNGTDIDSFFKDRLTEALQTCCSWIVVEHPAEGQPVVDKAAFKAAGLDQCWLRKVDFEDVLDWETDDSGALAWVLTHRKEAKRFGLASGRNQVTEIWDFYTADDVTTYAITYDVKQPPKPEDSVAEVGKRPHRFGRVPVVPLTLPVGLWVGNRLDSAQLAHFRLSNAQTWGLSRTCYAMPIFKLEDPANRPPVMGAGYGVLLGVNESMEWSTPSKDGNDAFTPLREEIASHKDEIFRIAHQMALGVQNNAAAVGRSAESKTRDAEATRVVLLAYSRVVKEVMEIVYDLITTARGDGLTWSIEGLDDFAAADVVGLADMLQKIEDLGGIPSKTWNKLSKSRLAEAALPDVDQKTKAIIRKEIDEGVENAPDPADAEIEQAVRMHEALNAAKSGGDRSGSGADAKADAGSGSKPTPAPKKPKPPSRK
jgi:hypothetical protein